MNRRRRAALWALAVPAGALLLFIFAEIAHHTADAIRGEPVERLAEHPSFDRPDFAEVVTELAGAALLPGHTVEVLTDLAVFDAMLRDIRAAKRSITFFTYSCEPGALGDRFARAMAERARAGVLWLGDGFVCDTLLEAVRAQMEAAGAEVAIHRPIAWYRLHRAQHRNHARLVVIDGVVGYTGGFGLADAWTGEADEGPWHDTSARFTGPAVEEMQAAFLTAWAEATRTLHAGTDFFPPHLPADSAAAGGVPAALVLSPPGLGSTPAERATALTVAGARRTLFISNSYFVPTPLFHRLLIDAARRGVDVRLLLPGPVIDHATTRWAGRAYYDELLAAGVRVWEYRPQMMHAKTIVADGVWSVLGTMNLDNRSTRLNDESMLLVHHPRVGAVLDSIFLVDLERSREITPASRRERSFWERLRERATRAVAPIL